MIILNVFEKSDKIFTADLPLISHMNCIKEIPKINDTDAKSKRLTIYKGFNITAMKRIDPIQMRLRIVEYITPFGVL